MEVKMRSLSPNEIIQLAACLPMGMRQPFDLDQALKNVDWPRLIKHIKRRNMAGLLLDLLDREKLTDRLPEGVQEDLNMNDMAARMTLRRYDKETIRLCTPLKEHGVTPLLLKGGSVGPLYYQPVHLRLYKDIDMLMLPKDVLNTLDILHELGYKERRISWDIMPKERILYDPWALNIDPKIEMTYRPEGTKGQLDYSLDLHWHPFEIPSFLSKYGTRIPTEAFHEASIPHPKFPDLVRSPCAEDLLMHLGIQMIVHDKGVQIFRLADALRIIHHPTNSPDIDRLEKRSKEFRINGVVYYLCRFLTMIYGPDAAPAEYLDRLQPARWRQKMLAMGGFGQLPDPLDRQFPKWSKRFMEMFLVNKSIFKIFVLYGHKLIVLKYLARVKVFVQKKLSGVR